MRVMQGHTKDVRAVAYTPDGRLVSGGGHDKTVRLWNVTTGDCTATIKAKGPVYAVAASPDGKTIAYGGRHASGAEANFVYLCDFNGKPIARHELRTQEDVLEQVPGTFTFQSARRWAPRSIWSLAFSADGKYIAAACRRQGGGNIPNGGGGRCWVRDGSGETALPHDAYSLAFARTGCSFAITRGKAVAFHTDPTRPPDVEYRLTSDWSAAVAFVPGTDPAVVGTNSFLDFMNPLRKEKATRLKTGVRTVLAVVVSPDGKTILAGGKPGTIEVYDTATRAKTTTYDFGIGPVHALAYAPDGLTFAAAGETGLVMCDTAG
jgi:WD40 repeat protein